MYVVTCDTKDILWMDDRVLIMTYEFLATRSLKYHILDKNEVLEDDHMVKMRSFALGI